MKTLQRLEVAVVMVLAACNDGALQRTCPIECYNGQPGTLNVGECRAGVPVCDDDVEVIGCKGEVLQTAEVCDGRDNNCDGYVDNLYEFPEGVCPPPLGVCAWTRAQCIDGQLSCAFPDYYEAVETRCDLLDNDCDGRVDEDLFAGQYCYTGPVGTEYFTPCHPGALSCVNGQPLCINEVVPSFELCDGADNDCDGLSDNVVEALPLDIVISIDESPSMSQEINAVRAAVDLHLSQSLASSRYRFAVVSMVPNAPLLQNFASVAVTSDTLAQLAANASGMEASYDAIYSACSVYNPLGLSWRVGAQRVYLGFTDEDGQSYRDPRVDINDLVDACMASSTAVYQWHEFGGGFQAVCTASGGKCFPIVNDVDRLLQDLSETLSALCAE